MPRELNEVPHALHRQESNAAGEPDWTAIWVLLSTGAVYIFAAWSLVALSWDGSGYLFRSLQVGWPVIPHHRYSDFPILWALIQARMFVDDPVWLAIGYGLLLSLTPLLSLAACFRILRGSRLESLRIWPVTGILLGVLPGEICLMSEASLAVQAFWPLAAFALAGAPRRGILWMAVFIPYLFFLHPTTAVMFALAATLCVMVAIFRVESRWAASFWAGIFGFGAACRLLHSIIYASSYERSELAWDPNWNAFIGAIYGWPMLFLAAVYTLGMVCLLTGFGKIAPRAARVWIMAIGAVLLGVGCWWASDVILWNGAISYRRFVLACALPLVAMAAGHWWAISRNATEQNISFCRRAGLLATWIFVIVFAFQVWTWKTEVDRFAAALRAARASFVTTGDLAWIRGSPLAHWSSTMLSVIIQGREPHTIFAEHQSDISDGNIRLFPGDGGLFLGHDGWFLVDPVHR